MTNFSINEYKSMFLEPLRIVEPISWIKHIPFAFFIIELLKPKIVVELGVHTGNSFSAFCQAVKNLNIKAPAMVLIRSKATLTQEFMMNLCTLI